MVSFIFKTANSDFSQYLSKNMQKFGENATIIFGYEQEIKKLNKNMSNEKG